ncbi:hypothetical protein AEMCBJ_05110 [Cupriavidus necator]|uniref:hypothetical protein n=1 Tax=Cupriavidus necator TaxID=106590 RepID=UPI003F7401AF
MDKARLRKYEADRKEAGFREIRPCVHEDFLAKIKELRLPGECMGRTLERLILGEAVPRPPFWTPEEAAQRAAKKAAKPPRTKAVKAEKTPFGGSRHAEVAAAIARLKQME